MREYHPTKINGNKVTSIAFPSRLYDALIEYKKFIYNKQGLEVNFNELVRSLLIKALKAEKAYEDESNNDEENS